MNKQIREKLKKIAPADKKALLKHMILKDFWFFVKYMDPHYDGERVIKFNEFYKMIAYSFQRSDKNLMFIIPRRWAKSLFVKLYITWIILKYPDLSILNISATMTKAKEILKDVKANLLSSKIEDLFGHVLHHNYNNQAIITSKERSPLTPGYNLQLWAINMPIQSKRADIVIYEDIIGDDYPASMAKKIKSDYNFKAVIPTLQKKSKQIYVGTRFAPDDIPNMIMEENKITDTWEIIEESVYDEFGKPSHPEIMDEQEITRLKQTLPPSMFSSQYLNSPVVSEHSIFNIGDYEFYTTNDLDKLIPTFRDIYFGVDLATMKNKNKGDFSTVIVVAKSEKTGKIYILDAADSRESTQDFYSKLAYLNDKWKPTDIFIEAISGFQFAVDTLQQESQKDGVYFPFRKITKQDNAKNRRIETLTPLLRNGALVLPSKSITNNNKYLYKLIYNEMPYFNIYKDNNLDDMLDALELVVRQIKDTGKSKMPSVVSF